MNTCNCNQCAVDGLRKILIDKTGLEIDELNLLAGVWYANLRDGGKISVPHLLKLHHDFIPIGEIDHERK